jgi:cell division transport system ATP-binding protein
MEVCGYTQKDITKQVPEVLAQVGLIQKKEKFIETLSGGEVQRTCIARALIHHPQIIIGDEPTGNLDRKNAEEIIYLLNELNKEGKTIIVATHDEHLVNAMKKRVIAFQDGKILSDTKEGTYCL